MTDYMRGTITARTKRGAYDAAHQAAAAFFQVIPECVVVKAERIQLTDYVRSMNGLEDFEFDVTFISAESHLMVPVEGKPSVCQNCRQSNFPYPLPDDADVDLP